MDEAISIESEARELEGKCIEDEEETNASTHFPKIRKNQLIDLMQYLERCTNILPVFGFKSGRHGLNLKKSYLIPSLVNEKDIEPLVIQKANDFVSFKLGNLQLLDILNFLGVPTTFRHFSKNLLSQ